MAFCLSYILLDLALHRNVPYFPVRSCQNPSCQRAGNARFDSNFLHADFSRSSHTSDLKLALQRLPCQGSRSHGFSEGRYNLRALNEIDEAIYCNTNNVNMIATRHIAAEKSMQSL